MSSKFKVDPEKVANISFAIRQAAGQAILAAGSIAYIVQNVGNLERNFAFGAAVGIVFLVLFFTNHK